jgi:hypothetical protein
MICSIVACGDSAKEWYKTPCDFSVGVNDCKKWGPDVDHLVCVNSPMKFQPVRANSGIDRLEIIMRSRPKKFYCHNSNWNHYFKGKGVPVEMLSMRNYNGSLRPNRLYFSKTSPFVAITLAVKLGARELILWGVDMLNHARFKEGHKDFGLELSNYLSLFDELGKQGIKVWIGNSETCLNKYLKVYVLREGYVQQ